MTDTAIVATLTPATLDETNPLHLGFKNRLLELEAALLAKDPLMKNHLAEIHKSMIQHEEIVHLLSEDDIAKIMAAQQVHVGVTLVAAASGKSGKAASAKKSAGLGMGDL